MRRPRRDDRALSGSDVPLGTRARSLPDDCSHGIAPAASSRRIEPFPHTLTTVNPAQPPTSERRQYQRAHGRRDAGTWSPTTLEPLGILDVSRRLIEPRGCYRTLDD
jgi:hypothetical protein